jgi:hypothetical protein
MSLSLKAQNVASRVAQGQSPRVVQRVLSLSPEEYNALTNSPEFAHLFEELRREQREKIGDRAKQYARGAFRTGRNQGGRS